MFLKLWSILTQRDKYFLFLLLLFSVLISVIETAGVGVILPFLSVAMDFSLVRSNEYYHYFYRLLSFEEEQDFVIFFGVVLIFFYIFRSVLNLFYMYLLAKFSQSRYHLLAYRLFENYLGLEYREFVGRNSSFLTKSIVSEANNLVLLFSSFLFIMSEIFVIFFLYSMMLFVNVKITFLLTVVLALNGFLMKKTVVKKIKKAGEDRESLQGKFYEIINRTFGNFKLIKLSSKDSQVLDEFSKASFGFSKSNTINQTLVHVPRLFLEGFGFSIIIFIIIFLIFKYDSDISNVLATVSMFVLALYRFMPSANRILSSYNNIVYYASSLNIIHEELEFSKENLGNEKIDFKEKIVAERLFFAYEEDKFILNNLSLEIKKGEKVAFIGESGSGKSTLVDLLIGLYKPKQGGVTIDGVALSDENVSSWRKKIGYIPQSVYLFDGTVLDNVVFGDRINKQRAVEVLKQANIYDFLESKEGLETKVGEGGIQLSGGQKQRIAIARALYKDPEILVLDEATSALDTETEEVIMEEIYEISKSKTLIIIAHRLSTIQRCERVYKIENGTVKN